MTVTTNHRTWQDSARCDRDKPTLSGPWTRRDSYGRFDVLNGRPCIRVGWQIVAHNCRGFGKTDWISSTQIFGATEALVRACGQRGPPCSASGCRQPSTFRNPSKRLTCWTMVSLTGLKFRCLIVKGSFTRPKPGPRQRELHTTDGFSLSSGFWSVPIRPQPA